MHSIGSCSDWYLGLNGVELNEVVWETKVLYL